MSRETLSHCKTLRTRLTLKRFLAGMTSQMHRQLTLEQERSRAILTMMRFAVFTMSTSNVKISFAAYKKCSRAFWTSKRTHIRVSSFMYRQRISSREAFGTELASKAFLSGVFREMLCQHRTISKGSATIWT